MSKLLLTATLLALPLTLAGERVQPDGQRTSPTASFADSRADATSDFAGVRCSVAALFGGPSDDVMHLHAVATGSTETVSVPADLARPREALPEEARAFEFRVLEAAGGVDAPAEGDRILVTPWGYGVDCTRTAWEGSWIAPEEETVLTFHADLAQEMGGAFHVLGRVAAYPQGGWHAVRATRGADPVRGWMDPGEAFELLTSLPSLVYTHENLTVWQEANARAAEVIVAGPAGWVNRYPASEILRAARDAKLREE